jgi:NTP pyrophosphatase (non-canonical NTP hydrolase)
MKNNRTSIRKSPSAKAPSVSRASSPAQTPEDFRDDLTTVAQLRCRMEQFVGERQWHKFHRPKNLAMSLAIEAAELMEHFQWLDHEQVDRLLDDPVARKEISDEMADVLSFLLSLANATGIDLASGFEAKMAVNDTKYPADKVRGNYAKPRKRQAPQIVANPKSE